MQFKKVFFLNFLLVFANLCMAQSSISLVEKLASKCSKGQIKSCEKLYEIAIHDKSEDIRIAAIRNIDDQQTLLIISEKDLNNSVRIAAINRLTSQEDIFEIIIKNKDERVFNASIDKIIDEDLLYRLALRLEKYNFQETAINKISNQQVLEKIVRNIDHVDLKCAALELINNQDILTDLANNYQNKYVRNRAIPKLTNQHVLMDIAKNENDHSSRYEAVNKITDQDFLAKIAENDYHVHGFAIDNITDQKLLLNLTKNETFAVRNRALDRITNEGILLDIAKKGKFPYVRYQALNRINEDRYYNDICDLVNYFKQSNHNVAAIGALKLIAQDSTLKKHFKDLEINFEIDYTSQFYIVGSWISIYYKIDLKSSNYSKTFEYEGKKGGERESISDINTIHVGFIDIDEICKDLLLSLKKEELDKIAKKTDVYFLRKNANNLLYH